MPTAESGRQEPRREKGAIVRELGSGVGKVTGEFTRLMWTCF
jgi:hypothetical protein